MLKTLMDGLTLAALLGQAFDFIREMTHFLLKLIVNK